MIEIRMSFIEWLRELPKINQERRNFDGADGFEEACNINPNMLRNISAADLATLFVVGERFSVEEILNKLNEHAANREH